MSEDEGETGYEILDYFILNDKQTHEALYLTCRFFDTIKEDEEHKSLQNIDEDYINLSNFFNESTEFLSNLNTGFNVIPSFPEIENLFDIADEEELQNVRCFMIRYQGHIEQILDLIGSLRFHMVEKFMNLFWRQQIHPEFFYYCEYQPVQFLIYYIDMKFYNNLTNMLLPSLFDPVPNKLSQAILSFAVSFYDWVNDAMKKYGDGIRRVKTAAAYAFCKLLYKRAQLHLHADVVKKLFSTGSINKMQKDYQYIDFYLFRLNIPTTSRQDVRDPHPYEDDFRSLYLSNENLLELVQNIEDMMIYDLKKFDPATPEYRSNAKAILYKRSNFCLQIIKHLEERKIATLQDYKAIQKFSDLYMFMSLLIRLGFVMELPLIFLITDTDLKIDMPGIDEDEK